MARRNAILMLLLTALSLAQVSSDGMTEAIRRVGSHLACLCGACKNSVADCPMLACHYAKPARDQIREMQAKGMSDDAIVAEFVKREGKRALVVPPSEGFFNLAWWMPPVMVGMGLMFVLAWIRKMSRPEAAPPAAELPSELLDKYRDSIEKDLARLD
ncbi:MAG: cytochrome c-type biogenesis protein CcmH [Bryobacteraceae bacterium]